MDYAGFDCKITVPLQSPIRHRRWLIVDMQAKAKPEEQLGDSETESKEPRRVDCGKSPQVGTCHP